MCTSICYRKNNLYFGRNLDVEFSFHEQVVVTPRHYPGLMKNHPAFTNRYAMIGMAAVMEDYPLYYEACNEKGLSMAGLNFPKSAFYQKACEGKDNVAPFEIIPWILGQASTVAEVRELLSRMNLENRPFSAKLPVSPLHFMISDKKESIVVEPVQSGLMIYENNYDVMTNEPPFSYHLWEMQKYLGLSPRNQENDFSTQYKLGNYAVGMGAFGLPGDASSSSRFVRAAFNLTNSSNEDQEDQNVAQFFHVLDSVAMVKGATITDSGKNDITLYSCCINTDKGIYYYKTYDNNQITAISLFHTDLDAKGLSVFDLRKAQSIVYEN